jgi:hypothetical protein
MYQNSSSNEQGVPLNATTILALLTLLGGVLVAGHKLASDRPVVPPGNSNSEISEQKVDTRLWEDPFGQANHVSTTNELVGNLAGTLMATQNHDFHLVAVMVPGGPASESRERRIRSRFAVVSALAESAYSPSHPSQIGFATMPWPSALGFSEVLSTDAPPKAPEYFQKNDRTNYMLFGFEWYEAEQFARHRSQSIVNTNPVLLLWLDEDQFGDRPIARLNLFLS